MSTETTGNDFCRDEAGAYNGRRLGRESGRDSGAVIVRCRLTIAIIIW